MELSAQSLSITPTPLGEDAMAEAKLIIPTEIKICATCSYWDGERQVDDEIGVVVVDGSCKGECLVKEATRECLHDVRQECDCLWEDLRPDSERAADDAAGNAGAEVKKPA